VVGFKCEAVLTKDGSCTNILAREELKNVPDKYVLKGPVWGEVKGQATDPLVEVPGTVVSRFNKPGIEVNIGANVKGVSV
jgi:hypothetical protein